ncbi:hypothetical protein IGI67_002009 [Enterococcus sp. AZ196]
MFRNILDGELTENNFFSSVSKSEISLISTRMEEFLKGNGRNISKKEDA